MLLEQKTFRHKSALVYDTDPIIQATILLNYHHSSLPVFARIDNASLHPDPSVNDEAGRDMWT